jgi:DNA-directed RNA polymerase subunit alpha
VSAERTYMIPLPKKPKIIKENENKGVFEIEALYPGYGVTIGNSLRRALLSSLEGAAITKVKIKGVPHKFSTIKGVLEDVILILLNLKKVRLKMYASEPQTGTLKVKGEKEVKASAFKLPPQAEIVNKNLHIATLTDKKAILEMEIWIEKGIGYEPQDRRKREKLEIGTISLDAIYTPIKNVAFRIENMRVGERTDYDRLIIEIETDGTISPEEALLQAFEILVSHFSFLNKSLKKEEKEERPTKKKEKKKIKEKPKDLSKIKIEELDISQRTVAVLGENRIKSVAGLMGKKENSILSLKGIGEKGLKEIKNALKKLGLELKSTD